MNSINNKILFFEGFYQNEINSPIFKTKTIGIQLGSSVPKEEWPNSQDLIHPWDRNVVILRSEKRPFFEYVHLKKVQDNADHLKYFDGQKVKQASKNLFYKPKFPTVQLGAKAPKSLRPKADSPFMKKGKEGDIALLMLEDKPYFRYVRLLRDLNKTELKFPYFDGKKKGLASFMRFFKPRFANDRIAPFYILLGQTASKVEVRKLRSDESFFEDEIIIVRRFKNNVPVYHYVKFKKIQNRIGYFELIGKIWATSVLNFFKIRRSVEVLNNIAHYRSNISLRFLITLDVYQDGVLKIGGTSYRPIHGKTRSFCDEPIASCGINLEDREIILLDPENSPLLNTHYQKVKETIDSLVESSPDIDEKTLILALFIYVKHYIFKSYESKIDLRIGKLLKKYMKLKNPIIFKSGNIKTPAIPLDFFIQHKIGVCRHFALSLAYMLGRLKKEDYLTGEIEHMRQSLTFGKIKTAHTWVIYKSETAKLHIDPFWYILSSLDNPQEFALLSGKYGKNAMEIQKKRFEEL